MGHSFVLDEKNDSLGVPRLVDLPSNFIGFISGAVGWVRLNSDEVLLLLWEDAKQNLVLQGIYFLPRMWH